MRQADVAILYAYNYWATKRILAAASKVSNDQFVARTAFPRGSLRGTLVHIMDAEYGWRTLIEESREAEDLAESEFPSLGSLQQRWHEEESRMRAYLANVHDESLDGILRYTNPAGIRRERVLWHCLFHVVNHGTQHRSEAAAMLTDYGQSPGDIDFSMFLIEDSQRSS